MEEDTAEGGGAQRRGCGQCFSAGKKRTLNNKRKSCCFPLNANVNFLNGNITDD